MKTIHPGQQYGHLTVLDYSKHFKRWRCRCDCGMVVYVASNILSNKSRCRACYIKSKDHLRYRLSINPQPDTSTSTTKET